MEKEITQSFDPSTRSRYIHIHQKNLFPTLAKENTQQRRKDFLLSLRFDHIDARQSSIKDAHSTTCEWMLQHKNYLAWKHSENPGAIRTSCELSESLELAIQHP
jgi:hypothetical protein